MAQERWDEAEACFRECMAEWPKRGGNQRAMAELMLRRDGQPKAALDAARCAVALDRADTMFRGKRGQEVRHHNLGESLAVFAWAIAKNHGDPSEVRAALDEALRLCPATAKPISAEIHFFAGHACALLGNSAESLRHFETAAEADPAGTYGRLAQLAASPQ
jgi:tetratricopeptide (TPR) repeat protein